MNNLAFMRRRMMLKMNELGRNADGTGQIGMRWETVDGGTADAGTGAIIGGTRQIIRGTLIGHVHSIPGEAKIRNFAEVKMGDMIIDLAPEAVVEIAANVGIDGATLTDEDGNILVFEDGSVFIADGANGSLAGFIYFEFIRTRNFDPIFTIGGIDYRQKDVSERLNEAWDVIVKGQKLHTTLLLRKAT